MKKDSIIDLFIGIILIIVIGLAIFNIQVKQYKKEQKTYQYEICTNDNCRYIQVDKIIAPSDETVNLCNYEGICEDVPINRLLLKHGTDKKYCNNAPYLSDDYVDNWWNADGLIDDCEMPPQSNMQFA